MLQFFNKDASWFANIESHSFESFKYGEVNDVDIEGNPESYLGKICYVYDQHKLIGSGIIESYYHYKNENKSRLSISPLTQDLRQGFYHDADNVITVTDDLANIVEAIITQYRADTTNPVLFIREKNLTGTSITHTFDNQSWLEAYNTVVNEFIGTGVFVIIDNDGGIRIKNTSTVQEMIYGSDIIKLEYEKRADEIVNYIVFTNGGAISGLYQNATSISTYGKRVKYIKDERFVYQTSADKYGATYLDKHSNPIISVQSIKTKRTDIQLYDKVSISNWEKNFSDQLYVNAITYLKDGFLELDIGTKLTREDLLSL